MKERRMVPEPDFQSYYGRPILKQPTWKNPDVPLYLFLGGMAGGSALLAEGAAVSGRPGLERVTRIVAASGAAAGTVALLHDLGRPERFLNMLRVLKVTSPLSVGSFILAPFSATSSVAAASVVTGKLPRLGRLAGSVSGALAAPLATYTAALIANTAVPIWHEAHRELPFVFAGSAATAAGGMAMVFAPADESGPAARMATGGAVLELTASELMRRRLQMLNEPYEKGRPGAFMRAARGLTAGGIVLSSLPGRSRLRRALAGAAYVGGSVLLRFAVFEGGMASAADPKYTVVPQRERVESRRLRSVK